MHHPHVYMCIGTDHQVKLYSSISNIVVAKAESNDGGHLDMDLLSYYCTGAMSGGRKEKPVIRIKAMEDNEYHVWFENEEGKVLCRLTQV